MPDKKITTQKKLAEIISKKKELNLNKKEVDDIIKAIANTIIAELENGRSVKITSFGTFSPRTRYARSGVSPRNPEKKIKIPSVRVAKFKTGKKLRDALKKKKK
jgi:nucleoid DNA-binding protein